MIKQQLRKIARAMTEWPLIGRLVSIGIAVIRLPDLKAAYLDLNHRQYMQETEHLAKLRQMLSEISALQQKEDS
ncbi:MAG TPA: hypothetical protein VFM46_13705, partial [Pseudomonadales bacterium]|nr:hypothetical protein [Pseudomonadales bacterium]